MNPGTNPGSSPRLRRNAVLLCDLDGTLIDSVPDLAAALGGLLAAQDRPPLTIESVKTMIGNGVPKLVERALAATGGVPETAELTALIAHYETIYEARMVELTRPYPGAIETLSALKTAGWRLAICSNKPERPCRDIIAALGFGGLFEAIAGGDSFAVRKPDPGHLLGLLGRMGASPEAAVMLGDGESDVQAARAAGLPVIAIAHGYSKVPVAELGADLVIEALSELPAALAALGR